MSKFLENQSLPYLQTLSHILGRPLTFVDLEATGLVHERHFSIIEIGLVSISPNNIIEKSSLVDPLIPIPDYITEITGITNQMVKGQKTFKEFNTFFFENLNLNFDNIFLKNKFKNVKNLIHFYLIYFNKLNKNKFNFFKRQNMFLYSIININLKNKKKQSTSNCTRKIRSEISYSPSAQPPSISSPFPSHFK